MGINMGNLCFCLLCSENMSKSSNLSMWDKYFWSWWIAESESVVICIDWWLKTAWKCEKLQKIAIFALAIFIEVLKNPHFEASGNIFEANQRRDRIQREILLKKHDSWAKKHDRCRFDPSWHSLVSEIFLQKNPYQGNFDSVFHVFRPFWCKKSGRKCEIWNPWPIFDRKHTLWLFFSLF